MKDYPGTVVSSDSTVRLRQNRLQCMLESGTVCVFEVPKIPQKGKENHQVNHGGKGGKFLEAIVPFLAG